MNTRIAIRLWLALVLFGTEAMVWAIASHPNTSHATTVAASTSKPALPAVLLPTINVHPDADELAAYANDDTNAETALDLESASVDAGNMPSLPRVRLSMPYYSFGKLLPHVRKD